MFSWFKKIIDFVVPLEPMPEETEDEKKVETKSEEVNRAQNEVTVKRAVVMRPRDNRQVMSALRTAEQFQLTTSTILLINPPPIIARILKSSKCLNSL